MPTSNYSFPYPSSSTAPDVPLHFQELAVAVDTALKSVADSVTSDNNTTYTVEVGGVNNAPTIALVGSDNTTDSITITAGSNVSIDKVSANEIRINAEDDSPTYTAGVGLEVVSFSFSLKHLGLETLTDPNADRILFWDDSAASSAWLQLGSGLSITDTTLGLDADLAAIAALSGTSGFLKKTALNTWELDTGVAANNQTFFIGTTQVAINRATGSLSLTGVSIDGNAGSATNLAGTTQYSIPYQSASGTTSYLSIGAANKILAVNSTATGYTWVDNGAGGSSTLAGLTDVQINSGTLGTGQVLKYDGTKWVNGEDISGSGGSSGNAFTTISGTSGSVSPDSTTDTLALAVTGGGLTIVAGEVSTVDTLTFELDSDLKGIASATLTTAGFLKTNGSGTYSVVTDNSGNWDTAYTDRLKWDGGSTGLDAATARTSLGLGTMATAATTDYAALAGATFTGTIITPTPTTTIASLRLPHGTAPTSPTNGDVWTTTTGMYIRINGATIGPLGTGGGGSGDITLGTTSSTTEGRMSWDATYHHAYIGDGVNLMLVPTFRINETTRTSGGLTAADCNTLVQFDNSTDITVTMPTDTSIPVGTQIHLLRRNLTGNVTVTTSGVIATPGYRLREQYSSATLIKVSNTSPRWLLVGDLTV